MQNNLRETTMYQVAKHGYKTEGIKFFWKGGNLILFRGTIHSGILFVTYENLKDMFKARTL